MSSTERFDVVIIGAGIIGCAAARELAPDTDVVVLEKDQVASGATGRATGNTSVVTGFHDYPDFAKHCNSFFRDYDGTRNFSYTERPRITLIPPEIESEARETAQTSANNGFETSFLTPDEIEKRYPGVFKLDSYAGGIEYQDIGWVDPYTYAMTLKEDAVADGAEVRTGTSVESISVEDGNVAGVHTTNATITAPNVVCAAGWRTRTLLSGIIEVPVYPFRWQTIDLDIGDQLNEDYPMGLDLVSGLYWRREHNGNLHIGGGETKVEKPGTPRDSVTERFRHKIAKELPKKLQRLEDSRIVSEHTCRTGDSTTPDTYPIIDAPQEAPDGLVIATGFHGRGIMASPAVGTAIRSLIVDDECPFALAPFRLDRFETRSADFEFTKILESSYGLD